jgi:hypothetical protein
MRDEGLPPASRIDTAPRSIPQAAAAERQKAFGRSPFSQAGIWQPARPCPMSFYIQPSSKLTQIMGVPPIVIQNTQASVGPGE